MYGDCVNDQLNQPYGFVYCTTNNINGRKYIGQHKIGQCNDDRYLGSGLFFKQALQKYGKENFSREILGYANSREELDQLEIDMINLYNAVENNLFYNIAPGAYAHTQTEETRAKISKTLTGIKRSDETKKKMSVCKLRENLSEETRRKISEANRGRKFSDEAKAHMSAAQKGHLKYPNSGIAPIRVRCIETGEEYESLHDAYVKTGIDFKSISAYLKGKTKSAKGFHFEKI